MLEGNVRYQMMHIKLGIMIIFHKEEKSELIKTIGNANTIPFKHISYEANQFNETMNENSKTKEIKRKITQLFYWIKLNGCLSLYCIVLILLYVLMYEWLLLCSSEVIFTSRKKEAFWLIFHPFDWVALFATRMIDWFQIEMIWRHRVLQSHLSSRINIHQHIVKTIAIA